MVIKFSAEVRNENEVKGDKRGPTNKSGQVYAD